MRRPLAKAVTFLLGMCAGWALFAALIPGGAL